MLRTSECNNGERSMSTLTCEVGENAPPVCLVRENPNRPVSLLDMLRVYAGNFIAVGALLQKCAANLGAVASPDRRMDSETAGDFGEAIGRIKQDCAQMGLAHTEEIASFHESEGRTGAMTFLQASNAVNEISRIYHSELRNRLFVYVRADVANFYEQLDLLGKDGSRAFPSSLDEIRDAGTCYALEQYTASVMHCMRALETALVALADEFGVDSSREQWHRIISDIEDAVDALGPSAGLDWRTRKEFYAPACQEFRYFKDAWRNHAMHSRTRYNPSETKRVLDHVIDFIKHLSLRLHEKMA
jgi:hypothetical protein